MSTDNATTAPVHAVVQRSGPCECSKCGRKPTVVKESDGYWYVLCEARGCPGQTTWATLKSNAIAEWNELHQSR